MTQTPLKLGVLASGRGSNLSAILKHIEEGTLDATVKIVVSDKEKAPALDIARNSGAESLSLNPKEFKNREAFDSAVMAELQKHQVDLVCLAGYMRIITPAFIKAFERRIINIHPSLLPAFPGLKVQQQALDYGARFSGCTVHFVDEGVDTGPIILQAVVPVLPADNADTLADRILEEEHKLYSKAIQLIADNRIAFDGRRVIIQEP